jgi:hypothetical protein
MLLPLTLPTAAQVGASLERLEIAIWPEYDRPAALVILRARLSEAQPLPATVRLPIPVEVGEPHAVAVRTLDRRLLTAPYELEIEQDWAIVSVRTDELEVWVEYYDELNIEGAQRTYRFTWPSGYAVAELTYEVQQPADAQEFQITPPGQAERGEFGLSYHTAELGSVSAADAFTIEFEYQKSNTNLSIDNPLPQRAQPVESLKISFWPEYDRSEVLVFYRVRLSDDTPLPALVSLPIPSRVGDPHAVAKWFPEGGLSDLVRWSRQPDGDWATVTIETDTTGVWLEFYDDLNVEADRRSYRFQWPGGLEIGDLQFEVQQPAAADELSITPEGESRLQEDGLRYYTGSLGAQSADARPTIAFTYFNPGGQLTNPPAAVPSLVRPEVTQGGIPDVRAWIPWALGAFGVVFLALGAFLFLRLRREAVPRAPRPRQRSTARKPARKGDREFDASPVFCHICGTQANVNDNFCRRCGTALRK